MKKYLTKEKIKSILKLFNKTKTKKERLVMGLLIIPLTALIIIACVYLVQKMKKNKKEEQNEKDKGDLKK